MKSNLLKYYMEIAVSPDKFGEFLSDPVDASKKAGLSPEEQSILVSGDQNQIYAELKEGSDKE